MNICNFLAGDKPFEEFSSGVEQMNKRMIVIDEKRYLNIFRTSKNSFWNAF